MKIFLLLFVFYDITKEALPGMKKSHNSNVAVTPIQYPGILNPDIYVQNYQSSPVVPEAKIPSVKMNLHIDGLEQYYHPHPQIVHHRTIVHHRGKYDGLIEQLFNKDVKKEWKQCETYYFKYKSVKSRKYGRNTRSTQQSFSQRFIDRDTKRYCLKKNKQNNERYN